MEMDNVKRKNIKFNVGAITIVLLLVVGMGLLGVNQLQYHKKESQRTHFILDNQSVQDSVNDPSIAVSENRSLHEVNMDNIIYAISSDEQEISYWGEQGLNSPYAPKTASDLNNAIAKVLNEKYRAAVVAHFGKVSHIRHFAQIIGAGYIHGGRRSIKLIKCFLQYCRRHRTAAERAAALRPQPYRLYIKESRGIYKGLVHIAGSHYHI